MMRKIPKEWRAKLLFLLEDNPLSVWKASIKLFWHGYDERTCLKTKTAKTAS